MQNFEIFLSVDAEGNSAVSLDDAETAHKACAEYGADHVRTICLSVAMGLPAEDTDEDEVTVIDVEVPEQEEPAEEADEAELPAEVHTPAEQSASAEVAA